MKTKPKVCVMLMALLVALAGTPSFAGDQKVVKFKAASPPVYTSTEGRFVRKGTLDRTRLTLPVVVIAHSRKGYVQVTTKDGPVWLDRLDVVLDPPVTIKATCLSGVSVASDATSALTRGAGERCVP